MPVKQGLERFGRQEVGHRVGAQDELIARVIQAED